MEHAGTVPNDVPKDHLFTQPLAVTSLAVTARDVLDDDRRRITFTATVKDAVGRRCPDLAVDARITGPERSGHGMAHTDEFGQVSFRMAGPAGTYRCEVLDVAAGSLDVLREAPGVVAAADEEL